jgi:hypothetical protein
MDVPERLPFLEAISWYDERPTDLTPKEMLERYESGWRYRGVLAEPSPEELALIRALVEQYGSFLRV